MAEWGAQGAERGIERHATREERRECAREARHRGGPDEAADEGQAAEAPIVEEGTDGVRLMTVHKAKGLEFPVVILADITAKIVKIVANPTP